MNTLTEYCLTHNWITAEEAAMCCRQWIPFRNQVSKFRKDKIIDVYSNMLVENDKDFKGFNVLLDIRPILKIISFPVQRPGDDEKFFSIFPYSFILFTSPNVKLSHGKKTI